MLKKNYSKKKTYYQAFELSCVLRHVAHTLYFAECENCESVQKIKYWSHEKLICCIMVFHSVPCSVLHSECETSPSQMLSHSLFLCPGPVKQMKANRKLSSLLYVISEPSPGEHATVFVLFGLTLYTIYVNRLYLQSPILMHLLLVHTF